MRLKRKESTKKQIKTKTIGKLKDISEKRRSSAKTHPGFLAAAAGSVKNTSFRMSSRKLKKVSLPGDEHNVSKRSLFTKSLFSAKNSRRPSNKSRQSRTPSITLSQIEVTRIGEEYDNSIMPETDENEGALYKQHFFKSARNLRPVSEEESVDHLNETYDDEKGEEEVEKVPNYDMGSFERAANTSELGEENLGSFEFTKPGLLDEDDEVNSEIAFLSSNMREKLSS